MVVALLGSGVAGAESSRIPEVRGIESPAAGTGVEQQEPAFDGQAKGFAEAGSKPRETQATLEAADSLTPEIDRRSVDPRSQREFAADSRDRFEERVRVLKRQARQASNKTGGSTNFHNDSRSAPRETGPRLDQDQVEYRESREEQRTRAEELRQREAELEVSVGETSSKNEQMEERLARLRVAEEAGTITRPPASGAGGGSAAMKERELEVAREDIVARPVESIPRERYVQIYKASAKRYGFEKDWYVLAAVGRIESDHGENMGPSSAGALGPMQFLPSTWQEYGVDGNRDGVANIMDPEDAIPAAARYLKAGGAPEDWYAALYTYNRAGWYVREVLGIAEDYRRQAKDDEVEPYV